MSETPFEDSHGVVREPWEESPVQFAGGTIVVNGKWHVPPGAKLIGCTIHIEKGGELIASTGMSFHSCTFEGAGSLISGGATRPLAHGCSIGGRDGS